ncbi:deoxyribodipyrimidine photo-lyase [Thalassospira sp.]|uniref:cryptochrome/photolyase family protein n=1 Tax=Thalassospira sp. TaxID=1912094 RepID=UPI0027368A52|nr:deoxyribodipyrimidine photo-lyase [Thalassospira sp.]MDP2696790.1 deoxyribodipyrimidine photo-lyase [Thalassospira sp.]
MSASPIAIMWFRNDLRLADNPALMAACRWAGQNGGRVLPVFIYDDVIDGQLGGATRWWLRHSLQSLDHSLGGQKLHLFRGTAQDVLTSVQAEYQVTALFWNRCYDRPSITRDTAIKTHAHQTGLMCESFNGQLLFEPWDVKTGSGGSFKVFSPFWRACLKMPPPAAPQAAPDHIPLATVTPSQAVSLAELDLAPKPFDWAGGLAERFTPGEAGARAQLHDFIDERLIDYAALRDYPDQRVTSELSPHLRFGEISPRHIWHATAHHADAHPAQAQTTAKFQSELGWREFAHHVLFHAKDLATIPLQPAFARFPWVQDADALKRWQTGQTGFPIVDAGMRELWHTGYMHNRVRMIVGSVLVKHLLGDWRDGLAWFDATLVDACPANNAFSWQWIGGCGADAAPYFRIFNPVLQGEKFDPKGVYVRQWVPELRNLPDTLIHKPWEAPRLVLIGAGAASYPDPVIGLRQGRDRAMAAWREMKKTANFEEGDMT